MVDHEVFFGLFTYQRDLPDPDHRTTINIYEMREIRIIDLSNPGEWRTYYSGVPGQGKEFPSYKVPDEDLARFFTEEWDGKEATVSMLQETLNSVLNFVLINPM